MSELRRAMLDLDVNQPELSPELQYLAARESALAALLVDHAALYRRLLQRIEEEGGVTEELAAVAFEAAGDLATLMQTLRRREDLLAALEAEGPDIPALPIAFVDQLIFSFGVLSRADHVDRRVFALTARQLDLIMDHERTRRWLERVGAGEVDLSALSARYDALDAD